MTERDVNSRIMGGSPTDPPQAARADLAAKGPDVGGVIGDVLTGDVRGLAGSAQRQLSTRSVGVLEV